MAVQKLDRVKENVAMKLLTTEKDSQLSLKQEQQSHEEDCDHQRKGTEIVYHLSLHFQYSFLIIIIFNNNLDKINRYLSNILI